MNCSQATSSVFSYRELPCRKTHVRLVDLNPSLKRQVPLKCSLRSCNIGDALEYTALSYTWGESEKPCSISVWEIEEASTVCAGNIMITNSLDICLRHLRDASRIRTLWIDQICINQEDENEKPDQILLMRQIYMRAREVIAWIGPTEAGSDRLMEVFKETGEEAEKLGLGHIISTSEGIRYLSTMIYQPNVNDPTTIALKTLFAKSEPFFKELINDMLHFYQRPWFRRTWIIQEMALGKKVYIQCGQKIEEVMILFWAMCIFQLCWAGNMFRDGFKISQGDWDTMQKLQTIQNPPLAPLVGLRNKAQALLRGTIPSGEHGMPMVDYLSFCYLEGKMEATNPRDKIFGLLALPADIEVLRIKPDYSVTVETVYTRAARAIFKRGNGKGGPTVELLKLCQFPKDDTLADLPSWVPDWRTRLRPSFCSEKSIFAAGGPEGTLPVIQDDVPDETIIGLRGYLVDQIEDVGEPWQPDRDIVFPADLTVDGNNGNLNRVFKLRSRVALTLLGQVKAFCDNACMKRVHRGYSTDKLREAHWRVPCGDVSGNSRAADSWKEAYDACLEGHQFATEEDPRRFRDYWQPLLAGRTGEENLRLTTLSSNYKNRMSAMTNMRPFTTENGHVGMAPMEANKGDVVVVFIGAPTPFVLRNLKGMRFKLLGEAYCHLVMDGEIISSGEESDFFLA